MPLLGGIVLALRYDLIIAGRQCGFRPFEARRDATIAPSLLAQRSLGSAFLELRPNGVLGSSHGPGPMLIIPTDALWALLEQALRTEATGTAGGSSTFREQILTSRQMPCRLAEAAGPRVPKRSLTTRRRAPGAPAPQQDDPGRCEAQFDPLGALPAFLPTRVVPDFGVEPDTGPFWLEHPFVRGEVLRVVQRRSRPAAVDGVARAERLHRRRART